jgi:DNA-binding IclR family transcriptional regulator
MMLKDLAQAADLAPAQCHAYLTSLRHVGLVHQDPVTGLYRTGSFALRLGICWLKSDPLAAAAVQELRALSDDLGIMSVLAAWGTQGPTIVQMNAGVTQTALNVRQGTVFSATGTATGRVFAAFGNTEDVEKGIAADLDNSVPRSSIGTLLTREDFEKMRAETRENGYAVAAGAPIPGINAVSAPIFGRDDGLAFVATLIGPADELSVETGSDTVKRLIDTAQALSEKRDGFTSVNGAAGAASGVEA